MGVIIFAGCCIALDVITGLVKAFYLGTVNSTLLRKGLYHKLAEILCILMVSGIQYGIPYLGVDIDIPLLPPICIYICLMEIISIIENLGDVNPELGKILKPYLEKMKGKGDDGSTERD